MQPSLTLRRIRGCWAILVINGAALGAAQAQSVPAPTSATDTTKLYAYVDQMPELITGGGLMGIVTAIKQVVVYPPDARQAGIEGRSFVSFTIARNGQVKDIKVVKGLSPSCDSAVVAAIKTLPTFIPGRQGGVPVSVAFTVPVTFAIQALKKPNVGLSR